MELTLGVNYKVKKIFQIIFLILFFSNNAYAGCGLGWTVGHIFDFSKEHKICAKIARETEGDEFDKNDAYCDCRERLMYR